VGQLLHMAMEAMIGVNPEIKSVLRYPDSEDSLQITRVVLVSDGLLWVYHTTECLHVPITFGGQVIYCNDFEISVCSTASRCMEDVLARGDQLMESEGKIWLYSNGFDVWKGYSSCPPFDAPIPFRGFEQYYDGQPVS
jgi:hypothetical protein